MPIDRLDEIILGLHIGRNDSPRAGSEGKAEHDSIPTKKGMSSATFEIFGWIGITYHDGSPIVTSLESGPDQLPDETVGAITPCHIPCDDGCGGTAKTAYPAIHTVSALKKPGELAAPLNLHPQFPEPMSQYGLDLGLGGKQDETEFARGKTQVVKTPLDTPSTDMHLQRYLGETPFQERVSNPKAP